MAERYRFSTRWSFAASPDVVFEALARVSDYPLWWPQFTRVERIDEDTHEMTVRSFLPYDVRYALHRQIEDPEARILEGLVEGDIHGRIRWEIGTSKDGRCLVRFYEDVSTSEWFMNLLAPVARWAFHWNHTRMMERGRVGLIGFLAGYALAKSDPDHFAALSR